MAAEYSNISDPLSRASLFGWLGEHGTRRAHSGLQVVLWLGKVSSLGGSLVALACVSASVLWLVYRAYCVLHKPLDHLVQHLGFDIPLGPRLDLAAIKADGVTIHWKPADERKMSNKYEIQVNGINLGPISHNDTSLVISNLAPDHNYVFRILAVSPLDFRAASDLLRVRTKPAASADYYRNLAIHDHKDQSGPIIRPFKAIQDVSMTSAAAPAMTREASNGPLVPKRIVMPRRPSPATCILEQEKAGSSDDVTCIAAAEESQPQLTERLEDINREVLDLERQIKEEEQDNATKTIDLQKERDDLRTALKEKDNVSKNLKKEVSALERENTAAQARRTTQDKALQQKRSERQKVKDDAARYIRETKQLRLYVEQCSTERLRLQENFDKEKAQLQERLDEDSQRIKLLEDDIRDQSLKVKNLEREKSVSPAGSDANDHHDLNTEQEEQEDRAYDERMRICEEEYHNACIALETARRSCQDAHAQLQYWKERQRQFLQFNAHLPVQQALSLSRHNSARQRHGPGDPFLSKAPSTGSFHVTSSAPFSHTISTSSAGGPFNTTAPFYTTFSGLTADSNGPAHGISPADLERLTGGAPMSPMAGAALLPAGLLSTADEEPPTRPMPGPISDLQNEVGNRSSTHEAMLPGLGAFARGNMLPGLGASTAPHAEGPASPGSVAGSRSPSIFASPLASTSNLAFQSPDALDVDGRSIRSIRSHRPVSGSGGPSGSRFAQILGLGFNRQRGKTLGDDGLALGKMQSISMPKEGVLGDASASANKRRNSSHSGIFFGSLRTGFGSSKLMDGDTDGDQKEPSIRRRPFMGLGGGSALGSLFNENRPVSPRPDSTHSTEVSRQAEPSAWTYDPFTNRSTSLGTEWGPQQNAKVGRPRMWESSHFSSRRTSSQMGPSGPMTYDIQEDDDDDNDTAIRPPQQAPIGTKPASGLQRPLTPKLNPAAQDFKSLFSFNEGKKDKSEKKDRTRSKTPDPNAMTPMSSAQSPMLGQLDDASPQGRRKSKDSRSILTAESSVAEASSRNSLDRTPSQTPSDAFGPSSAPSSSSKTSFMRKLSRKSSGGKFGLPSFQREKKTRNNESTLNEEPNDEMETPMGGDYLSFSMTTPGPEDFGHRVSVVGGADGPDTDRDRRHLSRTWSSYLPGLGKKKDKDAAGNGEDRDRTPSISDASQHSTGEVEG